MTGSPLAVIFVSLSAVVVVFQIALVCGAPWGHLTMGGRWSGRLPPRGRVAALVSATLNLLFAAVILAVARVPPVLPHWAGWSVVAILALGVVLHLITPSRAERRLWLPVIVVQMACALGILVL